MLCYTHSVCSDLMKLRWFSFVRFARINLLLEGFDSLQNLSKLQWFQSTRDTAHSQVPVTRR
jgi:hypothetical protein